MSSTERQLSRAAVLILRSLAHGCVEALASPGTRSPDLANLDPLRKLVLGQLKQKIETFWVCSAPVERRDYRRIVLFTSVLNCISLVQSLHDALWKERNRPALVSDEAYGSSEFRSTTEGLVSRALALARTVAEYVDGLHWVRTVARDHLGSDILAPPESLLEEWPLGVGADRNPADYFVGGDRRVLVKLMRLVLAQFDHHKHTSVKTSPNPEQSEDTSPTSSGSDTTTPDGSAKATLPDDVLQWLKQVHELVTQLEASFTLNAWANEQYRVRYIRRAVSVATSQEPLQHVGDTSMSECVVPNCDDDDEEASTTTGLKRTLVAESSM